MTATDLPLIDELLAPWRERLGADYTAYRNHVCRMLNFCFALHDCDETARRKACIAGAFHDLGIWSDDTIDYLPPSVALARDHLRKHDLAAWTEEVSLMIDEHHKLRRYRDPRYPLVEAFRKADLVDLSLGTVRFGLKRADIRTIKQAFPNAGFHKRLMQLAGDWFKHHPLSPPPFLKW